MVSINYATREVSCKIVYYGPGLSGKTTNLQYVHQKVPSDTKGKLISLATDADRTLYFDFLPINIGTINGFAAKFQLYTVPGQVYYNATRKLVLRGVDGLVFVADSQPDKMDENIESLNNLKENLAEYGYGIEEIPIVIQYNKQDLPGVLSPDEMRNVLNPKGGPEFKASATEGFGVFDTLKCILKMVLDKAKAGGTAAPAASPTATTAPEKAQQPAPPVPPPVDQPVRTQAEVPPPADIPQPPPTESAPLPVIEKPVAAQIHEPVMQGTGGQSGPAPAAPEPTAGAPAPASPAEYRREPVTPAAEIAPQTPPQYRPFPGNTAEDEERMMQYQPQETSPAPGHAEGMTQPIKDNDKDLASPAAMPRMAPSLKTDRPRKKRSFFKRLFGLK